MNCNVINETVMKDTRGTKDTMTIVIRLKQVERIKKRPQEVQEIYYV